MKCKFCKTKMSTLSTSDGFLRAQVEWCPKCGATMFGYHDYDLFDKYVTNWNQPELLKEYNFSKEGVEEKYRKCITEEVKGYFAYQYEDEYICFTDIDNWNKNKCCGYEYEKLVEILENIPGIIRESSEACWYYDRSQKEEMEKCLKECGIHFNQDFQDFLE